jgi:phage replication-related protein YjqB (UPF0714/DUF867 family)
MNRRDAGYRSYEDLARAHIEGDDYQVHVRTRLESAVAIVAPHGGGIEVGTSEVARAVAGDDFNFYAFEGCRPFGNFAALHLTSHRFDDRRCLELLSGCDYVVTIHGCRGAAHQVLVGGLDETLKARIAGAIAATGLEVRTHDHPFAGRAPNNICNRGRRGAGVQLELTSALRLAGDTRALVTATRSVLLELRQ